MSTLIGVNSQKCSWKFVLIERGKNILAVTEENLMRHQDLNSNIN